MRIICVTEPMVIPDAEKFARSFQDRFQAVYVRAPHDKTNGGGNYYPMFYVGRIPDQNEYAIANHEFEVPEEQVLNSLLEHLA